MVFYIEPMFFQRVQNAHQYAAGSGTSVRDRSEADLAGNHGGSEISFGEIIIGRDPAILSPVVEAWGTFREDFLDATDAPRCVEGASTAARIWVLI